MELNVLFRPPLFSAISFESGKWVVIASFDTPIEAVLYDGDTGKTTKIFVGEKIDTDSTDSYISEELAKPLTLKTYFWPKRRLNFKLTLTDLITIDGAINEKIKSKYESIKEFKNSRYAIGTRTVHSEYIREREIQPAVIQFLTNDGGAFVVLVNITTKINNPIAVIQLEDFLSAIAGKVAEKIGNWGRTKKFDELQEISVDDTKNAITVTQKDGTQKFYLDHLNDELKKYCIEIENVDILDKFPGDESSDVLKNKQKVLAERYAKEAAEEEKKKRFTLNEAKAKENETEIALIKGKVDAIADAQAKILKEEAVVAKAYGGKIQYLSKGGKEPGLDLGTYLATTEQQKKGGLDGKTS